MNSLLANLWLLFLFLFPFLYTQKTWDAFALRQSAFIFLCSVSLLLLPFCKKDLRLQTIDYALFVLFFFRVLTLIFFLRDPSISQMAEQILFEGSLCTGYLILRLVKPQEQIFIQILLIFSWLHALIAILQFASMVPSPFPFRANAFYFHPNLLGILSASLAVYFYTTKNYFAVLPNLLTILLSGSRLSASGTLFLLLIYTPFRAKKKIVALLAIFALAFVLFRNQINEKLPIEGFRTQIQPSLEIKLAILQSSLNAIFSNPKGFGAGMYDEKITPYLSEKMHEYFPNPIKNSLNRAHNFILQALCESGWIMLFPLLFALSLVWDLRPSPFFPPLITILILSLFCIFLDVPSMQIFTLFLLAFASNYKEAL